MCFPGVQLEWGVVGKRCGALVVPTIANQIAVEPHADAVVGSGVKCVVSGSAGRHRALPRSGPVGSLNSRGGRGLAAPIEIDRRIDAVNGCSRTVHVGIGRQESVVVRRNRDVHGDGLDGGLRPADKGWRLIVHGNLQIQGSHIIGRRRDSQPVQGGVDVVQRTDEGHRRIINPVAGGKSQTVGGSQRQTALVDRQRHCNINRLILVRIGAGDANGEIAGLRREDELRVHGAGRCVRRVHHRRRGFLLD